MTDDSLSSSAGAYPWPDRRTVLAMLAGGATVAAVPVVAQSTPLGRWEGHADFPGDPMDFAVSFSMSPAGVATGSIDILDSGLFRRPLAGVELSPTRIRFGLPFAGSAIPFEGEVVGDVIEGRIHLGPSPAAFRLKRVGPTPAPYTEERITIRNADVQLAGALLIPSGEGPHPVLVLQQATRPEIYDEGWLFWADWFARRGVATLVWNGRGSGGSSGDSRPTFHQVAGDGLAAVRLLRRRPEIIPDRIGLLASSQSGWIAPIVAAREPRSVAFIAMISGPGTTIARTVLYEAEMELRGRGFAPEQVREGVKAKGRFERLIISGASDEALDAARSAVANKPWFPHVGILPRGHWYRKWWQQVGDFDPAPYWKRVRCPVLNLHGEKDVELPVTESVRAMASAFGRGGNRRLTQYVFPGADHSLSIRRGLRPVRAPGVMDMLTTWVLRQARR